MSDVVCEQRTVPSSAAADRARVDGGQTAFVYGPEVLARYREALAQFHEGRPGTHLFQTLDWYDWHGQAGNLQPAVTVRGGAVVASALVRERRLPLGLGCVARVLWGPVAEDLPTLRAHCRSLVQALHRRALLITVAPFLFGTEADAAARTLAEDGWQPVGEGSWTYDRTLVVNLAQDLDTIRRGFRRSLRTQINKAGRLGVEVDERPSEADCRRFAELHNAMAAEQGIAPLPTAVADALAGGGNDRLVPLIARYQGDVVAGIVLIPVGDRVIYEWGTVDRDPAYRKLPLSHRLHWEGIRWAQAHGFRYYDFGGYWGEDKNGQTIDRFKTGFTQDEQHLVAEHRYHPGTLRASLLRQVLRMRKSYE